MIWEEAYKRWEKIYLAIPEISTKSQCAFLK